jgi:hypothetical protein
MLAPGEVKAWKEWTYTLAVQAATWGGPLVTMYSLRYNDAVGAKAKARPNQIWRMENISTPELSKEAGYVTPNVNTVYGFGFMDLRREPIILSVPDSQGLYYMVEIVDMWTNAFVECDSGTIVYQEVLAVASACGVGFGDRADFDGVFCSDFASVRQAGTICYLYVCRPGPAKWRLAGSRRHHRSLDLSYGHGYQSAYHRSQEIHCESGLRTRARSQGQPALRYLVGLRLRAALGATLVFRFQALGILGAALMLLALLIRQSIKRTGAG